MRRRHLDFTRWAMIIVGILRRFFCGTSGVVIMVYGDCAIVIAKLLYCMTDWSE